MDGKEKQPIGDINQPQRTILEALDLNGVDRELALMYLAQRIVRMQIRGSSLLNRMPGVNDAREQKFQEGLRRALEETGVFVDKHYTSPEERHRARTIELAINEFVAIAFPEDPNKPLKFPYSLTPEMYKEWGSRWRNQLAKPTQETQP